MDEQWRRMRQAGECAAAQRSASVTAASWAEVGIPRAIFPRRSSAECSVSSASASANSRVDVEGWTLRYR